MSGAGETSSASPVDVGNLTPGSNSTEAKRAFKRSYKACLNCRERKVRCDLGDLSAPLEPPCARCRREGKPCEFGVSKRGGVANVRSGLKKKAAAAAATSLPHKLPKNHPSRSNSNNENVHIKQEADKNEDGGDDKASADPISGKELHNTADALEILAHAARTIPKLGSQPHHNSASSNQTITAKKNPTVYPGIRDSTPIGVKLADSKLVQEKIIAESEARELIEYYFKYLHPFYPYISEELQDPDTLAEVPILLAAITSLASRYCYVRGHGEATLDLHAKLWDHCQALITKTVWAEASTRSIGTVFAFLLFSEWNPRAIHQRWNDYANDANAGQQAGDGITGFGAARRSDRMAWMLIGNGIRLAQDLGLMEQDSKVFLATHLSEIVLSLRMGRRSMLHQSLNEPVPEDLEFSANEQAKLGLLQIMSLAHETLYGSRKTTRELLKNGSYLTFLALFGPHLDNWERTYRSILQEKSLERESILFDYHYARLYIYSLALCSTPDSSQVTNFAEIIPSSRYVGMATDAAKELLAVADRVHAMGSLGQAPIRWVVRIVHAVIFLVKSIMLTPTPSLESHRHTLSLIRRVATTLSDSAPDEVHLSSRFGAILITLQSQIRSTIGLPQDEADRKAQQESEQQEDAYTQSPPPSQTSQPSQPPQTAEQPQPMNYETIHQEQQQQQQQQQQPQQQVPPEPIQHVQTQQHVPQLPVQQIRYDEQQDGNSYDYYQQQPQQTSQQLLGNQQQQQALLQNFNGYNAGNAGNSENLMSMMDMDFDFLMEGTEGLGFVEPLVEGIEQHQMMQQRQQH